MKKILSKVLSMSLAVLVAFGFIIVPAAVPVHADGFVCGFVKYSKKMTLYTGSKYGNVYYIEMGNKTKGAKSVTVKSSKKKVVEPFQFGKKDNTILVNAKKPGKATLKIKVKKGGKTKTYKVKVKVKKYSSPFKSVKVGSSNVTGKFKKEQIADIKVADNSKKKIAFSLKGGKKLKSIKCTTYTDDWEKSVEKNIKNNSTITVKKDCTFLYIQIYDTKSKITFAYYMNFI